MKQKRFILWIALIAIVVCFVACAQETPSPEPTSGEESLAQLLTPQRSQLLNIGQSLQLSIPEAVTVSSSDEKVATVDQSGLVTAVGKGLALITVSDSDESAVCGILVPGEDSFIDVTKLSAKEVFTDLKLHSATQILGMAVDAKNQAVYLSQRYGSDSYVPLNADILVNQVVHQADAWALSGWMRFSGSGKGSICVDNDGANTRLWLESGGDYIGYGKTLSLVQWSDQAYCLDAYGEVFTPQGVSGGMTVTADTENNMVLVYDRTEKCYRIYNRADMLSGEKEPAYVHAFTCKANQTPAAGEDDSQGRYNASVHSYALYNGYLYQFSGSSSIYLSVFDLNGQLQYCHRLEGLSDADYYMPAAVSVSGGKLYVTIASGSSEYNLANVLVFE